VWRTRGTQTGTYLGIPPTGKQIEYAGLSVNVLSEGKIKSTTWGYNSLIVLQQLGLVPSVMAA
jgi:predicted ester cyclase